MYQMRDYKNPAVIVDSNHSNSNKQFKEQIRIVKEVLYSRSHNADIKKLVKGFMIESYIEEGIHCPCLFTAPRKTACANGFPSVCTSHPL